MRNRSARIGAALALALVGTSVQARAQKPSAPPATDAAPATATATVSATPLPAEVVAPASTAKDEFDVTEDPLKRYYFLGLRYRGSIVPQAFMNIFVYGGATLYSNSGAIEMDIRKDGFSLIPNVAYTEYGSGNMIFLQHGKPANDVGNWSMVNSSIKVIYFGADLLWSIKLQKHVDLELGLGFQVGVVFGTLLDNWVSATNNPNATVTINGTTYNALPGSGAVTGYKGYFLPCATTGPVGSGCNLLDHTNATVAKVGGYNEPHGFNPVPTIFPTITIPQIDVRIKPIKSFEARVGVGFNLPNGFWFGFSGNYGLEKLFQKN
jgi:hypothetical protein